MRDFHSVAATARVALKTSADLVSCRLRPVQTEVSLLMGRWEAQFDFLQQRGLIVLQLDDEASLRLCGGLEDGVDGPDGINVPQ